jgi:hypothetical protein
MLRFNDKLKQISRSILFHGAWMFLLIPVVWYIHTYSPSIVIGDRLNLLAPIYSGATLFEGFFHQHGSHFLGITHLITSLATVVLGKTPNTDLWASVVNLAITVILLVALRKKLSPSPLSWKDVPLLLIPLSLAPAHSFFLFPHVHWMLPAFSLGLTLTWFISAPLKRTIIQCILIFCAAFSGYAFLCIPAFLIFDAFLILRRKPLQIISLETGAKFAVTVITGFVFYMKYVVALTGKSKTDSIDMNISYFIQILKNSLGMAWSQKGAFLFPFMITAIIAAIIILFWRKPRKPLFKMLPIYYLFAVWVSFVFVIALARSGEDPMSGLSARYYSTLLLLPISVFLMWRTSMKNTAAELIWVLIAVLIYLTPYKPSLSDGAFFQEKIISFDDCYRESKDVVKCNDEAGYAILQPQAHYENMYWQINTSSSPDGEN